MTHARRTADDFAAELTLRAGFLSEDQCVAARETFVAELPGASSFLDFLERQALLSTVQAAAVRGLVDHWRRSHEVDAVSGETAPAATLISQDPMLEVDAAALPELAKDRYDFALGPGGATVELGRGGLGRVVAVRDAATGRVVALKELLPTAGGQGADARFLREARVTAQLEHPAIVPVYEIGRRADGALYYTMRRIRGRTLAAAIAETPRLDERLRLVRHVLALAQALAYAHERAVVHRDVKPANVMLGSFGETWLLDWGLARRAGSFGLEAPTALRAEPVAAPDLSAGVMPAAAGTPAYMSPELARGEVDPRSDVFCAGSVLFELLARTPPRRAATAIEAVHLARTTPVPPVRSVAPDAPAELAAICDRALAFEPSRRYPSAAALAGDLEAWLEGRRVAAYEYPAGELLRRFAKKHRAVLSVSAAALVALVAVLVVAAVRVRREAQASREFALLLVNDVSEKLAPEPRSLPLVREVTTRATEYFAPEGRLEALGEKDRVDLAGAWIRIAELQLEMAALDAFQDTSALIARLVGPLPTPFEPRAPLAVEAVNALVLDGTWQWMRGEKAQARSLLEPAAAYIDQAIAAGPPSRSWFVLKLECHRSLGRLDDARGEFAGALRHYEAAADALAQLRTGSGPSWGVVYVDALIDVAIRQVDRDRDRALATGRRATEIADALPDLSRDPVAASSCGTAHRQLAAILRVLGHPDEARAEEQVARARLEAALQLDPSSMAIVTELGELAFQGQDFARAAEHLQRAVGSGLEAQVVSELMAAELFSGRPAEAIALRDRLRPDDFDQHLYLGLAYLAVGRVDEGLALLERLAQIPSAALNYPTGAIAALGRKRGGPVGVELERLGVELDAASLLADSADDEFTRVARSFAPRLRAAAGR